MKIIITFLTPQANFNARLLNREIRKMVEEAILSYKGHPSFSESDFAVNIEE